MSSGGEEPPLPNDPQIENRQVNEASNNLEENSAQNDVQMQERRVLVGEEVNSTGESSSPVDQSGDQDEDTPFEDANENEFEQYFVEPAESGDEDDHDDFFFDEEDDDDDDVDELEAAEYGIDDDDDDDDDQDANEDDLEAFDDDDDDDDDDDENIFGIPRLVNDDEYDSLREVQVNYDMELPSTHNYLGSNFQDVVASKHVHECNDEIELPLLPLPGNMFYENESDSSYTQLIPGQIMPIFFYSPLHIQVVRRRMRDQNPTIGFVLSPRSLRLPSSPTNDNNSNSTGSAGDADDPKLGIIAEIISMSNNEQDAPIEFARSILESGTGIILKIKGRERFRIVRLRKEITGCFVATVRILPEYVLDRNPLARQAMRNTEWSLNTFLHKLPQMTSCSLAKAESLNAQLNQPAWLYRYYDCSYLVYAIKKELETLGQKVNFEESEGSAAASASASAASVMVVNDSNDALVFSYWLLSNFPFDNDMRINCLKMDCINQRLIYMFSLLRNFTNISCRKCDTVFCTKHDVFSISKQGFMSAYLNPGGVVHETLTVFKLKNFSMTGARPSTQNTWFPGYGWQICYCGRCNCHIGWKFTPAKPNLKPEKFWGLTRTAIKYTYNTTKSSSSSDETIGLAPEDSHDDSSSVIDGAIAN